ncbi:MAG: hypothetical protein K2M82_05185 [Lachnospiraceae bacterium]|nr:hypothetical protein [Lachnospiraceae bacterium]
MKKIKKIAITAIISCVLLMTMSLTAFAVSANFAGTTPAHQKDTEVSTVRKDNSSIHYFTINVTLIQLGVSKICAWTENTAGYNFSDPARQVGVGGSTVFYSSTPSHGTNVVLNLSNPIDMSVGVGAMGIWDPH